MIAPCSPGLGKLELRVPQDRHGRFSTGLFESYQRSEKALVTPLPSCYPQQMSWTLLAGRAIELPP